jgi:hypothetical protein
MATFKPALAYHVLTLRTSASPRSSASAGRSRRTWHGTQG